MDWRGWNIGTNEGAVGRTSGNEGEVTKIEVEVEDALSFDRCVGIGGSQESPLR